MMRLKGLIKSGYLLEKERDDNNQSIHEINICYNSSLDLA